MLTGVRQIVSLQRGYSSASQRLVRVLKRHRGSQELQQARKLFEISRTRIDEQPQKGQGLTLSCLIVFPRWWALSTEAIEPNFRFITELVHVSHFVHDGATAIER